jgi:hypothetical protein
MSDQPLILGIPSKGRLQEATMAYFERAGLTITKKSGERNYRGVIKGSRASKWRFCRPRRSLVSWPPARCILASPAWTWCTRKSPIPNDHR